MVCSRSGEPGAPRPKCWRLPTVTGMPTGFTSTASGAVVGLVLGLVGGGGSILAVPLLVYVVGVTSPHIAIGTSAVAVSASALGNLFPHWRNGNVTWDCAAVFATAGVMGAFGGAAAAEAM